MVMDGDDIVPRHGHISIARSGNATPSNAPSLSTTLSGSGDTMYLCATVSYDVVASLKELCDFKVLGLRRKTCDFITCTESDCD